MNKFMEQLPVNSNLKTLLLVVVAVVVLSFVWSNKDMLVNKVCNLYKTVTEGFSSELEVKDATNEVPVQKQKALPAPKDKKKKDVPLSAKDLLPKSSDASASLWAQVNPVGETKLKDKNFLVGVDTQGSTLRNANLQLRADPPNPRKNVSPWMNSTIDEDQTRKTLC